MRIALLSYEYPPETGFGGIGTYTWYQARALAQLGHDVHVIAGGTSTVPSLRRTVEGGVVVWRYPVQETRVGRQMNRWRLWWSRNRWENGRSMAAAFQTLRLDYTFDVVEMPECGAEGLFLDVGANTATVVKLHSPAELIMGYYDVRRLDRVLCSRLERRALGRAGAVISGSRFLADEAESRRLVSKPIRVVPNGIDPQIYQETPDGSVRERYGIPLHRALVLMPGRLEHRKGAHLCPEIMAPILQNRPVAFVLAGRDLFGLGETTLLPELARQSVKGSVHALGSVSPGDLRALLAEAAAVLLPSLWENCPYAVLEAMAAGRPIVASDSGGTPELITNGESGLLASSGDAAGFSRAVARVLDEPVLGERLGREAKKVVEQSFSHLEVARQTLDVYGEVVS